MPFPITIHSTTGKINFAENTNSGNFSECCKCRNKITAVTNSHSTHHNSEIFGQGDPGKTPYNSWGKPVWKLLIYFWKMLLQWAVIHRKLQQTQKSLILTFVPPSTSKNVPNSKQIFQRNYSIKCCLSCLEKRARNDRTDSVRMGQQPPFSIFVPRKICLENRAPCCCSSSQKQCCPSLENRANAVRTFCLG